MSSLWERVRNILTDELMQQGSYEHAYSAGMTKGQESAANQIERLEELLMETNESYRREEQINAGLNSQVLTQGRSDIGSQLTEKLSGMADTIRSQWRHSLTDQPSNATEINADFIGQISAYNEVALLVHDLDTAGRITIDFLPEILDADSVRRGVLASASVENQQRQSSESAAQSIGPEHSGSLIQRRATAGILSSEEAINRLAEVPVLAEFLTGQDKLIREEWQRDLQSGLSNRHDLESYFAGKVDQHNTVIEMAVKAHPELQETLPPQINYEQLRNALQQQVVAQQEVSANAFGMAVER